MIRRTGPDWSTKNSDSQAVYAHMPMVDKLWPAGQIQPAKSFE